MLSALALRLGGALPVLLFVICALFGLIKLAPGDAATLLAPDDAGPAEVVRLRELWGLDQPLLVQLGRFIINVVHLDFGTSLRYQQPVASLIAERLPATLELSLVTMMIAVGIGVPLGLLAALHKGRAIDGAVSFGAILGVSAPSFWTGILLVLLFSSQLHLFPSGGRMPLNITLAPGTGFLIIDSIAQGRWDALSVVLQHVFLPAVTLALGMVGIIARITRSAVIDVGQEDFILTAVAKGRSRAAIVTRHIMPNAAIPISTIIGLELGVLISGTIIVEVVYSWPGLGTLLWQAVTVRDTPLSTGIVITYTLMFIILNVLIDLFYFVVDSRPSSRSGVEMREGAFLNPKFLVGSICLGAIVSLALFGQFITPHSPDEQDLMNSLMPPFDWEQGYIFGTDQLGRDLFARMVSGARVSLTIAFSVVALSGVAGVLLGALSGYWGGWRDAVIQKVVETFWAFPPILLAIAIVSMFGQTLPNLILALTVQRWIPYARVCRAQALTLQARDFVSASKVLGGGTVWILRKHIVPNVLASAVVIATFSMATAIIAEASLSFLGLGVPVSTPTWGGMLSDGRSYVTRAWWLAVFPGLGIFITVLGLNYLGDWLRDQFDPKDELNLP